MKSFRTYIVAISILIMSLWFDTAKAQYDPMFTNYMWNEMYINPGYAGSRGTLSVVGLLRDQWTGVDGAPTTQSLSIHSPIMNNTSGVGLNILRDNIGVSSRTNFAGTFAHHLKLGPGKLSLGLSLAVISRMDRLTETKLTDGGDMSFASNTPRMAMPNGSFGVYYYTSKYYVGISIPRLINNQVSADIGTKIKNNVNLKDMHYFLTAGYVFDLSSEIKLKPTALLKSTYGAPLELDLSLNALFREFIWAGLAYRTADAASLLIGVQINPNLRLGYSYDYTMNQIRKINYGSHEFCLGYDFSFSKSRVVSPRFF